MTRWSLLLAASAVLALPAGATQPRWPMGRLVDVDIRVGGRESPLYPARDGSGRLYFEASQGASYDIVLRNRSAERVGVVLVVDGLNVVSGERAEAHSPRNRMYVLDPWADTSVRGWRTSLSEVRRFTFVDERASYAARAGKANSKMGWIEVGVFREQRSYRRQPVPVYPDGSWGERDDDSRNRDVHKSQPAPPATVAPEARDEAQASREKLDSLGYSGSARSYPGTGWGRETHDPAQIVQFDPMPVPAQLTTLRYEYASSLRALGLLPEPWWSRDRLRQRERAEDGFAAPPAW